MRVLIVGCGDLGTRAGLLLAAGGHVVFGLRRRAELIPAPIQPIAADIHHIEALALPAVDAIVVSLTPDQRNEAGYRATYVESLHALIKTFPGTRLIFVGSTAVYGDHAGAWVDERSVCAPSEFNGRVLREAEALVFEHGGLVLRLGGIYGPGREWLIRRARNRSAASGLRWTNRIHVDDAAAAIASAITERWPVALLNVVDREPALECEVLAHLCKSMQLDAPPIDSSPVTDNKRVGCKALQNQGFVHRYPSYREGYAELLGAAK